MLVVYCPSKHSNSPTALGQTSYKYLYRWGKPYKLVLGFACMECHNRVEVKLPVKLCK